MDPFKRSDEVNSRHSPYWCQLPPATRVVRPSSYKTQGATAPIVSRPFHVITLACLTSARARLSSGSTLPTGASPAARAAVATASALATAAAPGDVLPACDALVAVLRVRCMLLTWPVESFGRERALVGVKTRVSDVLLLLVVLLCVPRPLVKSTRARTPQEHQEYGRQTPQIVPPGGEVTRVLREVN